MLGIFELLATEKPVWISLNPWFHWLTNLLRARSCFRHVFFLTWTSQSPQALAPLWFSELYPLNDTLTSSAFLMLAVIPDITSSTTSEEEELFTHLPHRKKEASFPGASSKRGDFLPYHCQYAHPGTSCLTQGMGYTGWFQPIRIHHWSQIWHPFHTSCIAEQSRTYP